MEARRLMEYLQLGRSDLRVSAMGIGTWQAGTKAWGHDVSDGDCMKAIVRAARLGINLVDTSEVYADGRSEEIVGKAVRELGRGEFVISTKVSGRHLRRRDVMRACEGSLRRLGTSQIDLYQVHWPDPWEQVPLKETMQAMEDLCNSGKVRAIGVSNFAVRDLEEAQGCLRNTEIVSNQVRYNMLHREIEAEVLPYCRKENITILAWSPLCRGALTGKYTLANRPTDRVRAKDDAYSDENLPQILRLVSKLREIGDSLGKTPSQVALNWITTRPMVIPIPGAKRPQQVDENVGALGWKMSESQLSEIDRILDDLEQHGFILHEPLVFD